MTDSDENGFASATIGSPDKKIGLSRVDKSGVVKNAYRDVIAQILMRSERYNHDSRFLRFNSEMTFETRTLGFLNERMRIASNGNVGIGTINPKSMLDVKTDINIGKVNNPGALTIKARDGLNALNFHSYFTSGGEISPGTWYTTLDLYDCSINLIDKQTNEHKVQIDSMPNGLIQLFSGGYGVRFEPGDYYEDGQVMVIKDDGKIYPCENLFDKRVVGVLSTAEDMGIILGSNGVSVAVAGIVNCKVHGSVSPVHAGDLLTTSDLPGHARKIPSSTSNPTGAVIGKALAPIDRNGEIPILVTLQ